ncbi:hypothetical protein RI543_005104 [Arxiozyma heterogenica]|uniref:Kri1-like C-terminal domain-containing protein n=1 Tax=Arxiozyma heterogenica TaxID=278026 RepID=A0AAN7WL25_9SACH|nr:hypothetical protein RI543_005104 [Kazachstania heterogenica]
MPRKKSAAKKAREAAAKEAALKEKQTNKDTVKDVGTVDSKHIPNENYSESDISSSSSSEEEDNYGDLITEDIEQGINNVLEAIKNNDTSKLLDPKVKFFKDENEQEDVGQKVKTQKPIYLKDYHRMNILSGDALKSDDELDQMETVDGQKSFVVQQRDERNKLLDEIKGAMDDSNGEDEDDDGFLKKKEIKQDNNDNNQLSYENDEQFLKDFLAQQAWIPKEGDKVIELDATGQSDDENFNNAVEDFENAYNFRYEDPNSAEIISYARNQATLRRSKTSSRRRKREEEKVVKDKLKKDKESKIQKKKTKKINKLTDVLEQLQKEFGAKIESHMVDKITKTLMNSDYKENEWDNVIAELFDDEFYNNDSEKPTWNDDDGLGNNHQFDDDNEEENQKEEEEDERKKDVDNKTIDKKSKKEMKNAVKREKKKLTEMVENAVEANKLAIIDEVENDELHERGRSKERNDSDGVKFRYREVSPESFGLTTREIFAADDADLNEFISLKKFAPYRSKELRNKDKRKVTKAKRIKEWRKKTFNDENGPSFEGVCLPKDDTDSEKSKKSKHHHKKSHKHKHSKK